VGIRRTLVTQTGRGLAFVLLLQVGACADSPVAPAGPRVAAGNWGGEHVALAVADDGAHVEFDCASGDISEPMILDRGGRFAVDGVYVQGHPGPVQAGEVAEKKPARYAGTVDDRTMTLVITLKASNEIVGTFALGYGARSGVRKCL
jgi:hypothetical protein